ncbi:uncharacterized protein LOC133424463 [Cololabis saira]|uniref:uncharacterized protein LOC133424463 n=1 Tax=Cololabis saira TaxID=129043 RepID=UPI002AD42ECF|nr:uncharacterized protein LOC133424463 [Cololabis saira]
MLMVVLLAAATGAVDVSWLTKVSKTMIDKLQIKRQTCVAANVPKQENQARLNELLSDDFVKEALKWTKKETIYGVDDIVVALARSVHAEVAVMTEVKDAMKKAKTDGDFLFIYSFFSPCEKCTTKGGLNNIVDSLEKHAKDWGEAVFVFSNVYEKPNKGDPFSREVLVKALKSLGDSMGGLKNVYRCYQQQQTFGCHVCSSGNGPAEVCLVQKYVPAQGGAGVGRSKSLDHGDAGKKKSGSGRSKSAGRA